MYIYIYMETLLLSKIKSKVILIGTNAKKVILDTKIYVVSTTLFFRYQNKSFPQCINFRP